MNHSLKNGFFFSPEGNGTISSTESGTSFENQLIVFKTDKPIQVSTLYLRDKKPSESLVTVRINKIIKTATRIGEGYAKQLKVDFSGTIDTAGATIEVLYGKVGVADSKGLMSNNLQPHNATYMSVGKRIALPYNIHSQPVIINIYDIGGKLVCKKAITNNVIDLQKDFGLPNGLYLIKPVIDKQKR